MIPSLVFSATVSITARQTSAALKFCVSLPTMYRSCLSQTFRANEKSQDNPLKHICKYTYRQQIKDANNCKHYGIGKG